MYSISHLMTWHNHTEDLKLSTFGTFLGLLKIQETDARNWFFDNFPTCHVLFETWNLKHRPWNALKSPDAVRHPENLLLCKSISEGFRSFLRFFLGNSAVHIKIIQFSNFSTAYLLVMREHYRKMRYVLRDLVPFV